MAVKSPQPTLSSGILSCVFLSTHLDEDGNEIIICSLVEFNKSVKFIFDKGGFDDRHMGLIVVI